MTSGAYAAVQLERITTGANSLVYSTAIGNQLFMLEQGGNIKLYDMQTKTTTNFLNTSQLGSTFVTGGETGLLGIAFDPDYAKNGYFYVNTTHRDANFNGNRIYSEVTRYTRSTSNPAMVDPNSAMSVIKIPKNEIKVNGVPTDFTNHNAGWLGFGKDKMLYVATGDGGSGGDPTGNAQNGQSLLGKILRLDVSNPTISYAIPKDNPFANGNGGANANFRDEIWAYGLRNPFRAGFDSKTGDLFIGDVGQDAWEEVDRAMAGMGGINFGWNLREGAHDFKGGGSGLTDPIFNYDHTNGQSVIGGTVFRGGGELDGKYLFSDFYNGGKIWALDPNCTANCQMTTVNFTTTAGTIGAISSFTTDAAGNLFISDYNGAVYRLSAVSPAPVPLPPAAWLLGSGLLGLTRARRRTV
jgi:hypothetical protein